MTRDEMLAPLMRISEMITDQERAEFEWLVRCGYPGGVAAHKARASVAHARKGIADQMAKIVSAFPLPVVLVDSDGGFQIRD